VKPEDPHDFFYKKGYTSFNAKEHEISLKSRAQENQFVYFNDII
jgi:hypothetical protein